MCLLVTAIAAIVSAIIWYVRGGGNTYRLGTLCCIYWGASLMWLIDAVFEYSELHADYFVQEIGDIINDTLLGITVVVIGLIAWLVLLLIKDPKGVFQKLWLKKNQ